MLLFAGCVGGVMIIGLLMCYPMVVIGTLLTIGVIATVLGNDAPAPPPSPPVPWHATAPATPTVVPQVIVAPAHTQEPSINRSGDLTPKSGFPRWLVFGGIGSIIGLIIQWVRRAGKAQDHLLAPAPKLLSPPADPHPWLTNGRRAAGL